MFFQHKAFWLAKDADHPDENQDAYAVDDVRGVAAIADGVSSSLFAGSWARLLADAAVEDPPNIYDEPSFSAWYADARRRWREPIDVDALPWHQRAKFAEGAHSTLLWIALDPPDARGESRLQAFAIGDCCLCHVRGREVIRAFPLENSGKFDTRPATLCSAPAKERKMPEFQTLDDVCRPGDLLVLCTDALAVWSLQQLEAGGSPHWESFWTMPDDAWSAWVLKTRGENKIRYDDTTALLLQMAPSSAATRSGEGGLVDEVKRGLGALLSGKKPRR